MKFRADALANHDRRALADCAQYNIPGLGRSDVVLDLGAHIGGFSRRCVDAGALVIAMEPEPGSFDLLRENVPEAILINAAVAKSYGRRTFYLGGTMEHTFFDHKFEVQSPVKSITVSCLPLPPLLMAFQPTIVKADIEGAEAELDWVPLDSVRELLVEYHNWIAWPAWYNSDTLFPGFKCVAKPDFNQPISMGTWRRT